MTTDTTPFITLAICQGGDELHEDHVRYCVPLAEQLTDTRTLNRDQAYRLLVEVISQYRENLYTHDQGMEQAQNEAVWGVLDGLFTDLDADSPECGCPDAGPSEYRPIAPGCLAHDQ